MGMGVSERREEGHRELQSDCVVCAQLQYDAQTRLANVPKKCMHSSCHGVLGMSITSLVLLVCFD